MEVFLYACEVCYTVRIGGSGGPKVLCVMCQSCKECQFHNKIEILPKYSNDIASIFEGYVFVMEERWRRKYDSTDTRDREET